MQRSAKRLSVFLSAILAGAWVCAQAPAPAAPAVSPITIGSVQATPVKTPEYGVSVSGMSTKRDGRQNWLMVSCEFDSAAPWQDEVTFTFYVALEARSADLKSGAPVKNVFSGSVTYMNVKHGRHQATMFLDHNTFERYGKVFAVAVEANIEGQAAGRSAQPASLAASQWWKTQTPFEIPLLRRDESPFRFVEIEGHNTIKP